MTFPGHDEKGRFTSANTYGGDRGGDPGRPEIYTEAWLEIELAELKKWMSKEKNIYFKRFCAERDYHPNRLRETINKFPRFSGAMEIIDTLQECKWAEGAATKKFEPGICKAMLMQMGVIDNKTTVIVKKESDPVSIAFNEAMGNSKNLVSDDTGLQSS